MKFYRAIIRNTRYSESYEASRELFKTKKLLIKWFKLLEEEHKQLREELKGSRSDGLTFAALQVMNNPFSKVLVGIEEVEVK